MTLTRIAALCAALAAVGSCARCGTIVFEERFSQPFVVHDWVYNNSGNNNEIGYPGRGAQTQPWPCMISEDGRELLGYEPRVYYATSFESFPIGPISGQDGWTGSGTVADGGHGLDKSARFVGQSAYRNVTDAMERDVQYVQCYVKCAYDNQQGIIYVGTRDAADIAAVVRLGPNARIEALDGDGVGGGTWVDLVGYAPDTWYRITIKIDYSTSTYRAAVNGAYNDTDLAFRDSAAGSGLGCVKFEQIGGTTFYVDDVYAGNTPYAPGQDLRPYWSDSYNHWSVEYGTPLQASRDIYDWMSCYDLLGNPVNTDPTKAPCYKASLPEGWTAAFGMQFDQEPQKYYASGRGKMGFTRLMGAYAQSPDNPCLHIWSSQGDLRVASPDLACGPGVYTLTWRGGVWNLNTIDPAMQYKWTDFCSWGFGYTNWCVWDPWDPKLGYLQTIPPYPLDLNWVGVGDFWVWPFDPFKLVDPDGTIPNRPDGPHPPGEEPGAWHTFTGRFAFGLPPAKDGVSYGFQSDPGYFIGFRVGHGHDPWNEGSQWGTILNVDDVVLTREDPVTIQTAKDSPTGTLVEISDLVVANMVVVPAPAYDPSYISYVDVYLEKQDRTAGIMLRAFGSEILDIWDSYNQQFKFQRGDVVRIVGAVIKDDPNDDRDPWPDNRNPVKYISASPHAIRLPAMVATGAPPVELKPVAINSRALVGQPVTSGRSTDGMLVTVCGRVNHSYSGYGIPSYFYVDDGGGLLAGKPEWNSPTSAVGVRIDCRGLLVTDPYWMGYPQDGDFVAVTGTCTAEKNPNDLTTVVRVVYPRDSNDIVPISN